MYWLNEYGDLKEVKNSNNLRVTSSNPVPDIRLLQAARRIAIENKGGDWREKLSYIVHSCPKNGRSKAPWAKRDRRLWGGKSALQSKSSPLFSCDFSRYPSNSQIPNWSTGYHNRTKRHLHKHLF